MDKITVNALDGPIDDSDLAGLIDSEIGLWEQDAIRNNPTTRVDWPQTDGAQYFREVAANANAVLLAARADGVVVGHLVARFAAADDFRVVPIAVLESMQIRAELRGRGAGGQLVEAFLAWAAARGASRTLVTASAANQGAQAFYQRHGFRLQEMTFALDLVAGCKAQQGSPDANT
jgi:GNAT superfamily N-acetyltransferase